LILLINNKLEILFEGSLTTKIRGDK